MLDFLEVVIKLTERCNINCSYCYMFNRGNEDYKSRPPYMTVETARSIGSFLAEGVRDMSVRRVSIVFHGGEPMLMKKSRFDEICRVLRLAIPSDVQLSFGMQTNAMLVDEEWITLFERHKVGIGVSLDGPAEYHDVYRVDHSGRGTYAKTEAGVRQLHAAAAAKRIRSFGAICVISPHFDGRRVYRHLVDSLGFKNLSINLPMETYDTIDHNTVPLLGRFMVDVFDEWVNDDDPGIQVRMFHEMMRFFRSNPKASAPKPRTQALVVISDDGDLSEDDPFKVINFAQRGGNVRTTRCIDFVQSPLLRYISQIPHALPTECRECCWQNYCRGGSQHAGSVNRYSAANGFANKSVLCEALKQIYAHCAAYLLRNRYSMDRLEGVLDFTESVKPRARDLPPIPSSFFSRSPTIPIRSIGQPAR